MARRVEVVFSAETGQFVAAVDGASKSVTKSAQAVAQAKNEIVAAMKMQLQAAKDAGAGQEELAAITKRAAQQILQVESDAQSKLEASYQQYLSRRFSALQAAAAREANLARTQMEEQTRMARQAALRSDIQTRNPGDPLSVTKSGIAAAYMEEVTAAKAAGASEEELAAITKKYAQQRVQAVEEAEEQIVAARQASLAKQYEAELAASEQGSIRQKLEQEVVPTQAQPMGFWEKMFGGVFGSSSMAGEAAKEVKNVSGALDEVGTAAGRSSQPVTALFRGARGNSMDALRTATAFAGQFEVIRKVASAVFIPLGLLAVVGIVKDGIEQFKKWYETAQELPSKIADGFGAITAPLQQHVDGLRKANDELEVEIAHLEKKPANNLAIALDDAREMADRLAESAHKADDEVAKLLKDNQNGLAAQIFLNKGSTADISGEVQRRLQSIDTASQDDEKKFRYETDTAKTDTERKAALDRHNKRLEDIQKQRDSSQQYIREKRATINGTVAGGYYTDQETGQQTYLGSTTYAKTHGDQTANNTILNKFEDLLDAGSEQYSESKRDVADAAKKSGLENAKKAAADEAEAVRKAVEAQKQAWKKADDARIEAGQDSAGVETDVWAERRAALQQGQLGYIQLLQVVNTEVADKLKEQRRQDTEEQKKAQEQASKSQREGWQVQFDNFTSSGQRNPQQNADFWGMRVLEATPGSDNEREALNRLTEAYNQVARAAEEVEKAKERAAQQADRATTSYQETALAIQMQTGQISRQDAAIQQANIHLQAYQRQMADLKAKQAHENALDPSSAGSIEAAAAIEQAKADRRVQVMQDAANTAATTWEGALNNATANWAQNASDTARQVTQLFDEGINGLNDNLSNLMSGDYKKGDFKKYGKGLFKTGSKDLLEQGEVSLFGSALGGKPDGTASRPYHVVMADGKGGAGLGSSLQSAGSWLGRLFGHHGGSSDGGSDGGSDSPIPASGLSKGVGGIFGALSSVLGLFGGHKAVGGGVQAGVSYDVGEMGREEFVPSTDGVIIPHSALSDNSARYTVNVANGVTPEQMAMHVQSALKAFHPQVVRDSVSAVHDHQRRTPASRR